MACGDGGFVRRDGLAVTHPDFGAALPCPHCQGARKNRNFALEGKWYAERDRLTRPIFEEGGAVRHQPTPPPDGFAKTGIPVPTTVTEEQRERARIAVAREIAAVAAKMKVPAL